MFDNNLGGQFTAHLGLYHKMSLRDYSILTEFDCVPPRCACGLCSEIPVFRRGRFKKYAPGHSRFLWREEEYVRKFGLPTCLECGNPVGFGRGLPLSYCSFVCSGKNTGFSLAKTQKKIKEVVFERYGVKCVSTLAEVRKKLSVALTGKTKTFTDEWRRRIGEASKRNWEDPKFKRRVSARIKEATNTPAEKKRRSVQQSKLWRSQDYVDKHLGGRGRLSSLHRAVREALSLEEKGFCSEQVVGRYIVDELNRGTREIIEVYGDYAHANPAVYDADFEVRFPGQSYLASDKWAYDKKRENYLRSLGFNIRVIWESDFYSR